MPEAKPICERIGSKLRKARDVAGLSLDRLAAMTELSKTGLWEIENGHNEPRAGTLLRIARALGVTCDYLMDDEAYTEIVCPECGNVEVRVDAWSNSKPASGLCPKCQERLYFVR